MRRFNPISVLTCTTKRSIFNVGDTKMPATVSFLAPAYDARRSNSATRDISMQLIVAMNKILQTTIPGRVGRYDDTFNPNCVGDAFQMLNTPTILIEAGHSPEDYEREQTRMFIFFALTEALNEICEGGVEDLNVAEYLNIPENNKLFFDILIKNVGLLNSKYRKEENIGVLYKEVLENKAVLFQPYIEKTGTLTSQFGHLVLDCKNAEDVEKLKELPAVHNLLI